LSPAGRSAVIHTLESQNRVLLKTKPMEAFVEQWWKEYSRSRILLYLFFYCMLLLCTTYWVNITNPISTEKTVLASLVFVLAMWHLVVFELRDLFCGGTCTVTSWEMVVPNYFTDWWNW
jgi:hypothetical protein